MTTMRRYEKMHIENKLAHPTMCVMCFDFIYPSLDKHKRRIVV